MFHRKRFKKEEQSLKVIEENKEEEISSPKEEAAQKEEPKVVANETAQPLITDDKEKESTTKEPENKEKPASPTFLPIDVKNIESVELLEEYGLEHLKHELTRCGLKCGGTLKQRAERLFLLKTQNVTDLPKKYLI